MDALKGDFGGAAKTDDLSNAKKKNEVGTDESHPMFDYQVLVTDDGCFYIPEKEVSSDDERNDSNTIQGNNGAFNVFSNDFSNLQNKKGEIFELADLKMLELENDYRSVIQQKSLAGLASEIKQTLEDARSLDTTNKGVLSCNDISPMNHELTETEPKIDDKPLTVKQVESIKASMASLHINAPEWVSTVDGNMDLVARLISN